LELAVPGTYTADSPLVTIEYFVPQLVVITSKQRPRKLTIHGSDGNDHAFLLKGHEDLRQDERVMQLFGLVNTLLENSRKTSEKDLSIQRYAVIPLSPNSGLIGWVPNCDTLHALICEYRDARKIFLNQEHRLMLAFAPDYDHLPLIAKVEVFRHALNNTEGNDLGKVLWLKSRTSEVWLERRTNYTRSLAVMSMVGYLLGLGDRHPSNLMLDRHSGKILHIDFGDCFEASMNREKFPEKVPFRLTRMLMKAMEVSGIEGTFRTTCENVMQVLRTNRDSVMAMMEAFVHDPLINWRLFNFNEVPQVPNYGNANGHTVVSSEEASANRELMQPHRGVRERELLQVLFFHIHDCLITCKISYVQNLATSLEE
jgi:FKBP12-rapamycin complex-associated protein